MKVRYTPKALADLESIYSYVQERSPAGAARIKQLVHRLVEGLADFPDAGPGTDMPNVRALLAGRFPYRIFYRIQRHEIEILHIRHTSRGPSDRDAWPD